MEVTKSLLQPCGSWEKRLILGEAWTLWAKVEEELGKHFKI